MICPSSRDERALTVIKKMGIEIDYCNECQGVWLDRGELNKMIKRDPLPGVI